METLLIVHGTMVMIMFLFLVAAKEAIEKRLNGKELGYLVMLTISFSWPITLGIAVVGILRKRVFKKGGNDGNHNT